jgi:lysophospholipase
MASKESPRMMPRDLPVARTDSVVPAADGTALYLRCYAPEERSPDRTLVIVHGTGEHGDRYDRFARMAAGRGWSVVAGDLRGHGRSGGTPTHLQRFEQYLEDLDVVLAHIGAIPNRTVLVAHSMGGLTGIRYAQTRPDRVGALVTLSPLLAMGLRVPPLKILLGKLCLAVAPKARFRSPIQSSQVTRCHEARRARDKDPLRHRTVTASWYFRVQEAVEEAWAAAGAMTTPLLLLQGERDEVVCPNAPLRWYPQVAAHDKSLLTLRDHLHELLTEPDWYHTAKLILDWLEVRMPLERATIPFPMAVTNRMIEPVRRAA